MRKLGDLIAAHVPEIAQTETNDCGQVIAQTGKQLIPRAADNFYYFAEMCTRVDGHTYPTRNAPETTRCIHPTGVCALISPWNVAVHDGHLEGRALPGLWQHGRAQDERAQSPMTAARLGELAHGSRHSPRRAEPGARLPARTRVTRLCAHPDVRAISFTGSTVTGNRIVQSRGLEEVQHGARGKEPVCDL